MTTTYSWTRVRMDTCHIWMFSNPIFIAWTFSDSSNFVKIFHYLLWTTCHMDFLHIAPRKQGLWKMLWTKFQLQRFVFEYYMYKHHHNLLLNDIHKQGQNFNQIAPQKLSDSGFIIYKLQVLMACVQYLQYWVYWSRINSNSINETDGKTKDFYVTWTQIITNYFSTTT